MDRFDDIFQKYQYASKTEDSLKEFSNWLLAISIGISGLLMTKTYELNNISCGKYIYFFVLTISLINTLFSGYNKYKIYIRDIQMNIFVGEMKKLLIFSEINNVDKEVVKDSWNELFQKWVKEFNKINNVGKLISISIFINIFTILLTGMFHLALIIR